MPKKPAPHRDGSPWWMKVLAIFGAIAIVGVLLTLFSSFGRRPADLSATEAPPVDSPDFLAAVAGIAGVPWRAGGTVRLLNNGDEIFPALLADLRAARKTIDFSVYIWEEGRTSDQVFDALVDRARAGVQVRLLLDGLGCMKVPEGRVQDLKAAGGRVVIFRPARFGKLTRFHKRNHRRAIVIDGEVGYTGGAAVADKWVGHADTPEHWRDTMVRVTGPLATTLQSAFAAPWAHSTGEMLSGPGFFPPSPPAESSSAAPGGETLFHVGCASSPSSEDHPLLLFFGQSILSARRTLYIATPYFVPDEATRKAVARQASRGVDVRILLPDDHTDATLIRLTSHRYYEPLLAAGVRIYEYQATMLHTKALVVDGRWTIVGSANMDVRSKELNHENVLGILDATFAARMNATFLEDLGRAREVRLEEWRKRGLWEKTKERVASLFAEQY